MQAITTEIVQALREAATNRTDLLANPMKIIGIGMEFMKGYPALSGNEKKALLVRALTSFAAGEDGILGTSDDKVPKPIVDTVAALVQGNLINDVIALVADASKGRFNAAKAAETAKQAKGTFSGCFGLLMSKIKKQK